LRFAIMTKHEHQIVNSERQRDFAPGWYVVGRSADLRKTGLKPVLLNTVPLVTFRDAKGQCVALLDRCAHRNAPLSAGRVAGGRVQCHYHGWEFDGAGECKQVPGLCGAPEHPARKVPAFACRESQGWVWVYSEPDVHPDGVPYAIPCADEEGYLTIREHIEMPGPLDAVAENALDVPHTAFVHSGLFRSNADRTEIDVIVRALEGGVEAEYVGEQRPEGIVGRILAPEGGEVSHWDRFLLPGIAQVEYRLSDRAHIVITAALTPRTAAITDLFATVAVKVPVPDVLLKTVIKRVAMRILNQDIGVLRAQTQQIARFGGEDFASTEIDVLGLRIKKLLRDAASGRPSTAPDERRIKMLV
jgi:nitrite reductase/ring-hydroxylating ferredoxin subunit